MEPGDAAVNEGLRMRTAGRDGIRVAANRTVVQLLCLLVARVGLLELALSASEPAAREQGAGHVADGPRVVLVGPPGGKVGGVAARRPSTRGGDVVALHG